MRLTTLAAAALGSAAALVGFAGAASASATVDLIWIDVSDAACTNADRRDCPRLGTTRDVSVSDNITLLVLLTAGPGGVAGAGVSVDYTDWWLPGVIQFRSFTTPILLPFNLGTTTHQPPFIDNINAASMSPGGLGIGLPAGQSAYLGTVSFHNRKRWSSHGVFAISAGANGPGGTDGVIRLSDWADITATTTFNNAYLLGDANPLPGCADAEGNVWLIEINALRAGGKTVVTGPNETVDVTAKARILKGTAIPDTTLDTTLTIEAVTPPGGTVIGTNSTGPITLGVGKGGKGAKLAVDTEQCVGGVIEFVATFSGTDQDGDDCSTTRALRKACR